MGLKWSGLCLDIIHLNVKARLSLENTVWVLQSANATQNTVKVDFVCFRLFKEIGLICCISSSLSLSSSSSFVFFNLYFAMHVMFYGFSRINTYDLYACYVLWPFLEKYLWSLSILLWNITICSASETPHCWRSPVS